ncbi:MAG: hypothetical protein H0W93_09580, partial [Gammaproteobacteria bacterium]|nr:hypothetical protein [Gammaproteobacteria bacterium]
QQIGALESTLEQARQRGGQMQAQYAARQTELQAAESRIAELAQSLEAFTARVSTLEQANEQVRAERAALRDSLAGGETDLIAAEARIAQLSRELEAASETERAMQSRVEQARTETLELRAAYDRQQSRVSAARERSAELDMTLGARTQELRDIRQERVEAVQQSQQSEQRLTELRGDFDTLRVKYDRLIQPARSADGKHVVEVRYDKEPEGYRIGLKDSADQAFSTVSGSQMMRRLDELKARYGNDLYVRVIIPDNSGLSYNEAWDFTNDVLSRYDYYYQTAGREPGAEAVE